ncbi:MAG: tyrosine-type recombinase/integrase [Burkholderiales bacterium]|nr:tyrosine-type recombinase/integrase [Burkholderiales bacterium]
MTNQLSIQNISRQIDAPTTHQAQSSSIQATNDIDAIKTWLNEFINSTNTFISYRQTAERFIMWLYKQNINLKEVTREVIQSYEDFLQTPTPQDFWCGPSRPRHHEEWKPFVKGLSISSIRLNLQVLGSMFQYLIEAGYLTRNPFRLIRQKVKPITAVERFLTHREWDYVTDFIDKMPIDTEKQVFEAERIRWIFNLLYLTGCRRSEVINATMADFISKRSQWWLKVIGKGNKYGEIPVPNTLLSALIRYRRAMGLSDYPNPTENNIPLIFSKYGKMQGITDSMLYKIIKKACSDLSDELKLTDPASAFIIGRMSTHWLRHTSATHQVDSGIDIRIVKENLRHSMLETTMKYQHTEADARYEETINKFGKK